MGGVVGGGWVGRKEEKRKGETENRRGRKRRGRAGATGPLPEGPAKAVDRGCRFAPTHWI